MSLTSRPSLAWLQGKGKRAGLGWLAGWGWGGSQRKDRFNKEEEREAREREGEIGRAHV